MRCPNIAPERKGFCIEIMPPTKSTPETTAALSGPENTANGEPAEEARLEPGATPCGGFSDEVQITRFALQRNRQSPRLNSRQHCACSRLPSSYITINRP